MKAFKVTKEDVLRVAQSIGKSLDEHEVDRVIELYPAWEKQDPTATWDLIVEDIIYFIMFDVIS